ncbi:TIGR04086 family membrane protein [Desulfuribacillus alkaliarsenatis]|uniref:TIGR04086 family membrane protein n=1 Tax=Desulfuribacillus alkaliarsenatis TaxID=766136 RepID=A0A1E5G0K5_9FIRM|nr:TIGR04086 family membrane protein [Desulfuribacillus alkaliarsenatis]OEF96344.1 hypothetical protein BHF68_09345 [Desulfuribacillus alkaliarsenatis]
MAIKNPIFVGFTWAFMTSISLLLVLIILVQFTSLPESSLPTLTYAIHIVSILIGALKAGFRSSQKGWYAGALTGFIYMLLIVLFGSMLFSSITLSVESLIQVVIGISIGAVGGIVGVNFNAR